MLNIQFVKSAAIRRPETTRLVYKKKPFRHGAVTRFTFPPQLRSHDGSDQESDVDDCSCLLSSEESEQEPDQADTADTANTALFYARLRQYECKCKRHALSQHQAHQTRWPNRKRLFSALPKEVSCARPPVFLPDASSITLCSRLRPSGIPFVLATPPPPVSPVYLSARYEVWCVLHLEKPAYEYHQLVRNCLAEFGTQWVTLVQLEAEAAKLGVLLDTHLMQCSRYGAGDRHDVDAWGHFFPYFEMGYTFTKLSPQRVYVWRVAPEFVTF